MKYANDKFEARKQELIQEGKVAFVDQVVFYTARNIFFIPEQARWAYLMAELKHPDLALHIDAALAAMEQENESLRGALPSNYYASLALDRTKLATLLDRINDIDTLSSTDGDLMGRVYEYFLSKFAIAEDKGKGEFYTPKTIVQLMAELIEPYSGKIYDPCCGSGGMFGYSKSANQTERLLTTGRVGTIGVVKKYHDKVWTADNVLAIKSQYYEYCYQHLCDFRYEDIMQGGVQSLITQTHLSNAETIIPSEKDLGFFERDASILGDSILSLEAQIACLEKMKQLLLTQIK